MWPGKVCIMRVCARRVHDATADGTFCAIAGAHRPFLPRLSSASSPAPPPPSLLPPFFPPSLYPSLPLPPRFPSLPFPLPPSPSPPTIPPSLPPSLPLPLPRHFSILVLSHPPSLAITRSRSLALPSHPAPLPFFVFPLPPSSIYPLHVNRPPLRFTHPLPLSCSLSSPPPLLALSPLPSPPPPPPTPFISLPQLLTTPYYFRHMSFLLFSCCRHLYPPFFPPLSFLPPSYI